MNQSVGYVQHHAIGLDPSVFSYTVWHEDSLRSSADTVGFGFRPGPCGDISFSVPAGSFAHIYPTCRESLISGVPDTPPPIPPTGQPGPRCGGGSPFLAIVLVMAIVLGRRYR